MKIRAPMSVQVLSMAKHLQNSQVVSETHSRVAPRNWLATALDVKMALFVTVDVHPSGLVAYSEASPC